MNIQKVANGNELEIILDGRLDTNTAVALEQEIVDMQGVKALTLNLKDLQYVSSAGLRVILMAHKKMRAAAGTMEVKHPNEMVMEVFEMTGFNDILKITR